MFLGRFWAYVRQPHGHIGWATSMPFAPINPTNPTTDPWNFWKKILRIGGAGKWPFFFFLSRPFWIYFFKKFYFLFFFPMQIILAVHMRYHLFLHCGYFLQNLGKDAVRTNMHTTVEIIWELLVEHAQCFHSVILAFSQNTKSKLKPNLSSNNYLSTSWIVIRLISCFVLKTSIYNKKQLRSFIAIQLLGNCF